ncbi:hypothetical protein CI102_2401 [Trichoderma harzianum]|uniref:Uncharacterized protein n=1 Tax=Trichoderma harzianum CBS 226.95 TaxID=983964 RepID=A0A2T4AM77_TRIHA|nr:hypothetical protein M431DRAFT_359823 [Trichoderma harzianum CBS 226.95]PKK52681.1 hypothetical protein CI102_2401 [Trichoderma harzianum]PTB58177.1 hypothetical protein M431DRAFT_359823 [Trichoderma harzianum CBS 226.95]
MMTVEGVCFSCRVRRDGLPAFAFALVPVAVAGTCRCGDPCSALQVNVPGSHGHPQASCCSTDQALAETFPLFFLSRLPSFYCPSCTSPFIQHTVQ